MALRPFLNALQESGHLRVPRPPEDPACEREGLEEVLAAWDQDARLDLPFAPPPLSLPSAAWAVTAIYRSCQFLVYRDFGAETVVQQLSLACPDPPSPRSAYSVDLTLRFLPDLISLARGIAEGDPLVAQLRHLARAWPLSSVGVPDLGPVDPAFFLQDRCLRQLYADRILERRDLSRLAHPDVREAVAGSLGLHRELCPEVAAGLASREDSA